MICICRLIQTCQEPYTKRRITEFHFFFTEFQLLLESINNHLVKLGKPKVTCEGSALGGEIFRLERLHPAVM